MIVGLTGCSHALSHGYLLIFPAVLLLLKEEFSLGYLGLGVIGNIMSFTYGLGALPGGMIYNRLGPRKLFLLCFLGSTVASLMVAFSSNFIFFTVGLALLGALGSVYHPLANALITAKVREYGRALGIHGAAGNLGLATAPFIAGLIASRWGWRQAYLCFAVPGVVLAIWSLFIDMSVGKKKKVETFHPNVTPLSMLGVRDFWVYFSLPLVILYVNNMLNSFCYHGIITFLPTYMSQRTSFHIFSWDSVAIGGMLSGVALFMGVFGQYTGGVLGQRPHLVRNLLVMTVMGFPFILAMSLTTDLLLLFMALIYFFFTFCLQPMTNVVLAQYTTLKMRGTAFGIYFFAAFGIGSLAASFSGYLAQTFGLQWAFLGLSGVAFILIVFTFFLLKVKKPTYASADLNEES
ncbi:MAG: MFS transporter [Proteobacteria bacterium]|nr:MFS transporter [Pseudomonadota bacterium]